jgi:DNA polymerase I-like protein with 3'-5' exonuclease and polymerase domains
MQQQPARDEEIGPMWRRIYIPDEGGIWAACDYSQQEPRMLIHFAELCGLNKASEAADRYRNDPSTDNHQMMADLAGVSRKQAKIIFLGACYGMGEKKLCKDLGLPTKVITLKNGRRIEVAGDEGKHIFDTFHSRLPFVRQLENLCEERAKKNGYISTLLGRRCRFPRDEDGLNYDWTHKALNRLIQGSSADQTKRAMVEADRAGHHLQLQVHDEIDLTVDSREEAERLGELMENVVEMRVPSKVDVETGPSWGEVE